MKYLISIIVLSLIIVSAVIISNPNSNNSKSNKNNLNEVILIINDKSTSTNSLTKCNPEFLWSLFNDKLKKQHKTDIGIFVLSNPEITSKTIKRFIIEPLPTYDVDEVPSIRDSMRSQIERSLRTQKEKFSLYVKEVERYILNYQPPVNDDYTAFNQALKKAMIFMGEENYKNYKKCLVIISDCIDDVKIKQDNIDLGDFRKIGNLEILLTGCKKPKIFNGLNYKLFESISGIKEYLTEN